MLDRSISDRIEINRGWRSTLLKMMWVVSLGWWRSLSLCLFCVNLQWVLEANHLGKSNPLLDGSLSVHFLHTHFLRVSSYVFPVYTNVSASAQHSSNLKRFIGYETAFSGFKFSVPTEMCKLPNYTHVCLVHTHCKDTSDTLKTPCLRASRTRKPCVQASTSVQMFSCSVERLFEIR